MDLERNQLTLKESHCLIVKLKVNIHHEGKIWKNKRK